MFGKSIKKLTGALALAAIMAGMVGNAVPAQAANTSDTSYVINVQSSSGSFQSVQERDKQNNSKVYVKISSAPSTYVHVRAYGNRNTATFYNETVGTTATVQKGVASSITNNCYEHKKSNYTYVLARVGFRSGSSKTGQVTGVWSPDSTKNYTVVN